MNAIAMSIYQTAFIGLVHQNASGLLVRHSHPSWELQEGFSSLGKAALGKAIQFKINTFNMPPVANL